MNEIRFVVCYTPAGFAMEMSEFMRRCDLSDGIGLESVFVITTKTKITKMYIQKMEKGIRDAIEKTGGRVYSVEYESHNFLTKKS
jgi:hypothetical protein